MFAIPEPRPRRVRLAGLSVRSLPAGIAVPLPRSTRRQGVVHLRYASGQPTASHVSAGCGGRAADGEQSVSFYLVYYAVPATLRSFGVTLFM
jgi:hypothetical protein